MGDARMIVAPPYPQHHKTIDNVHQQEQQHPSQTGGEEIERQVCLEKLCCLLPSGFADKQQHGGRKGRAKLHHAIHVNHRRGVEDNIEHRSYPASDAPGCNSQQQTDDIEIEKEF